MRCYQLQTLLLIVVVPSSFLVIRANVVVASDPDELVIIDMKKNRNVGVGFDSLTYETVTLRVALKTEAENPFIGPDPKATVDAKDGDLLWKLIVDEATVQGFTGAGLLINSRFSVRFKARLGGGEGPGPGDPVYGLGSVADVDIDVDTLGLRSDAARQTTGRPTEA